MTAPLCKIKGFKIRLRKREILKTLKYDSRYTNIDSGIEKLIQQQIENAYLFIYPSVIYKTFLNTPQVKNEILLGSKKVSELLHKASAFTLMAVTIGDKLEKEVNRIKDKNLTEAFVLDAAGSEATEQSANFVSKILREEASKEACYLSVRFSPGYGDWSMEASGKILEFLDEAKINVKLSSGGILVPRKSITAIQAWLPDVRG